MRVKSRIDSESEAIVSSKSNVRAKDVLTFKKSNSNIHEMGIY